MRGEIVLGDSLEVLKKYPDNCFDTVITDPPYGLSKHSEKVIRETFKQWLSGNEGFVPNIKGFMDMGWDAFVPPPLFWREVFRVVKPGATLLIFAGSRTQDLMTMSLRLAGFEIKDTLMWLYGTGFPKSTSISKQVQKVKGVKPVGRRDPTGGITGGKNTNTIEGGWHNINNWFIMPEPQGEAKRWVGYKTHSLKPAYEPIIMAMKPNDGSYANNALKWGVAGLNIDAGRVKTEGAVQGRFPTNVIFDEESAELLDEQTRGKVGNGYWAKTKVVGYGKFGKGSSKYFGVGRKDKSKGGASRFFYVAKASKKERNLGLEDFNLKISKRWNNKGEFKEVEFKGNVHPTVKPLKLITYLVKLTSMPNKDQVYLDPFVGSGTTAMACELLGKKFVGIEKVPAYYEIAKKRLEYISANREKLIKEYL